MKNIPTISAAQIMNQFYSCQICKKLHVRCKYTVCSHRHRCGVNVFIQIDNAVISDYTQTLIVDSQMQLTEDKTRCDWLSLSTLMKPAPYCLSNYAVKSCRCVCVTLVRSDVSVCGCAVLCWWSTLTLTDGQHLLQFSPALPRHYEWRCKCIAID